MELFSIEKYHKILCPEQPEFIFQFANLYLVQRLQGVGLLCGTDWTPLYHNSFFYSRYNHSVGCALIVWNFTHNKKQTLAGLLHDVSTPAFSHVTDFRNGDALTQQSTEYTNADFVIQDVELGSELNRAGMYSTEVCDYHKYPIADNEIPQLSADRLEYMYPSGAALANIWNIRDIEKNYKAIAVLQNEYGSPELGFTSEQEALIYVQKFCAVSELLQHNENKLALQLMADCITRAIELEVIEEQDLYTMSEDQLLEVFTKAVEKELDDDFSRKFKTFRGMKKILHTEKPVPNAYCVSLETKRRFVDPLVQEAAAEPAKRLSQINKSGADCIAHFLTYHDTKYGCAYWL